MPKLKKGHNIGFKAGNVPHKRERKVKWGKIVPYIRLSDKMLNMVLETLSTAEREDMVVRPGFYHLWPRKQTE